MRGVSRRMGVPGCVRCRRNGGVATHQGEREGGSEDDGRRQQAEQLPLGDASFFSHVDERINDQKIFDQNGEFGRGATPADSRRRQR